MGRDHLHLSKLPRGDTAWAAVRAGVAAFPLPEAVCTVLFLNSPPLSALYFSA